MKRLQAAVLIAAVGCIAMEGKKEPDPLQVEQTYSAAPDVVYAAMERVAIRNFTLVNSSKLAGVEVFQGKLSSGFCSGITFEGKATVDPAPADNSRVQLEVRVLESHGCMAIALRGGGDLKEKFRSIFWAQLNKLLRTP
jgi:hypothetical protein